MRMTSCLCGLFLIALVDSASVNNWKSHDNTRKVFNRKLIEDIKRLSKKGGNNTRDIISEVSNSKEGNFAKYLNLKDYISKSDIANDADSLNKDTNERNNNTYIYKDRFDIHHEGNTGTGEERRTWINREENVEKESVVNTETNNNTKMEKDPDLKTGINQQRSNEVNDEVSMKEIKKENTKAETDSKVNIKTGGSLNKEANSKVNIKADRRKEMSEKDHGVEEKTELEKSNYKGQENKNTDSENIGDTVHNEKHENTKENNEKHTKWNPGRKVNNAHSSKQNLPAHVHTNLNKTATIYKDHIMKTNNDLKRKESFINQNTSKKVTSKADVHNDNDIGKASSRKNINENTDNENDNHVSTGSEFEHKKAEAMSNDVTDLGTKIVEDIANISNQNAKENKDKDNSVGPVASDRSDDEKTKTPALERNMIKVHEGASESKGPSTFIPENGKSPSYSVGPNRDELNHFTSLSIDRSVSSDTVTDTTVRNASASEMSANRKQTQDINSDANEDRKNVTLLMSDDSRKAILKLTSMKENLNPLTTVKMENNFKEHATELERTSKEHHPTTTGIFSILSSDSKAFSQRPSVLSFENEDINKKYSVSEVKTARNLQQMENQRNVNKLTKTKFENNLAEKSSADPCQRNVDTSRQYTGSAVIAAAVGGVFIGAFAVVVLFHMKQKCNKYINGDYRRVPMEYDFELNPRFKTH